MTRVDACFVLGFIFLLAAAHPFITYPLSLMLLRPLFRRPIVPAPGWAGRTTETFSICLCACNEEKIIRGKVQDLLALRRATGDLQILVYVDGATDRTAEILREYGGVLDLVVSSERRGKTHGMNRLVGLARGSVVLFTDANVAIASDAVRNLRPYFADAEVGCVCGNLTYRNDRDTPTAEVGALYWSLDELTKQLETDTGSAMGADGSLFAIRRSLHRPPPEDLFDDIYVSFRILCDGWRVVRAPDVRAFEAHAMHRGEEFRRKVRIGCQAFNNHRLLWPCLRRLDAWNLYKYLSHRFLRWIAAWSLGAAALFLAAGLAAVAGPWTVAAAVAGAAALLGLGHAAGLRPVPQLVDILLAVLGTGIGVWQSLRGVRVRTWTPVASARAPIAFKEDDR